MAEKMFYQPPTDQEHFAYVPAADIQRSSFDRSHGLKTTFDAGYLIPCLVDEVLPGDTYHMKSTAFLRLATPLRPVMDNMYADVHYWFVPYRLVWDNWQRFMGERLDPDDVIDGINIPIAPFDLATLTPDSIANYMGMPFRDGGGSQVNVNVNCLPIRAYALIWNEWYRDQNLQDRVVFNKDDGPDGWLNTPVFRRGKRHDYFTSCLPWPQKGDPVLIPISPQAPVVGIGADAGTGFTDAGSTVVESDGDTVVYPNSRSFLAGAPTMRVAGTAGGVPQIFAELAEATAVTINDLRSAFQIQKLLERDARSGTRYKEIIKGHFRVESSDQRLQRPEYLGGGTTRVNINPIASTFAGGTIAQGDLGGVGTAVNGAGFTKSFEEHGVVIGLISVRADLTYQQGIERFWWRQTRYDYYWPSFANLGEQAVLNREIYVQGTLEDNEVFGYQERYAEYRYKPSRITGLFNSGAASSLDVWHLGQDFSALPVLNASFIQEDPPIDRVIAVPDEPHFLCDMWFNLRCERPMPVYSVPGFIDHF